MAVTQYKKSVKLATTKSVTALVDQWPAAVVQCRSWRHAWDAYFAIEAPGVFCEIHQCSRCKAFRYRLLGSGTGKIIQGWSPRLPEGYEVPLGTGRIVGHTLDVVRYAAMQSVSRQRVDNGADLRRELHEILKKG